MDLREIRIRPRLPPGSASVHRRQSSERPEGKVRSGLADACRRRSALAQDPGRSRLGRARLAEGTWRLRMGSWAPVYLGRRDGAGRLSAAVAVCGEDGRARHHGLRHAGTEGALSAAGRQRRTSVVPGLFRTERRIRLGDVAHDGGAQGRQVRRQRHEDLELLRARSRLDVRARAHLDRRQDAGRHLGPADRHEVEGHFAPADHHDRRFAHSQRDPLRECRGSGRQSHWRREQGLDLREIPAWATNAP